MNKIVNLVSATVLSGLMAGYAWADISSELVVSYPFDNNANDVSGNDYHGKVYGATQKEDRLRNRNLESDSYGFDGQSYIKTADIIVSSCKRTKEELLTLVYEDYRQTFLA